MNEEKQNHTSEAPEEVTEDNFMPYNVVAAAMNIPEIEDPLPLPPGVKPLMIRKKEKPKPYTRQYARSTRRGN